jgi:hypothetical protein
MAFLAEREAQSWQVNQEGQAYYFIQAQQEFLQEHLVDWIATFRLAVGRASLNEFYASLVDDTFSFISEDLGHLYKSLQPGLQPNAEVGTDLLQAQLSPTLVIEKTLRKIVHHLITPVEAGLYLSKADLFSLAQTMQLPASGGDRFDVLRSLFEAAGQYGVLEGLLEKLIALVEEERNNVFWLQLDYNQAKPIWQEWQHKLEVTLQLLEEMKQAVMANPEEVWTAE